MTVPNWSKIESFFYKLALGSGIIVLLFSFLNGYGFLYIIFRTALAFILIYFLGQGLLKLWQSITPVQQQGGQYLSQFVDVMVGDDLDVSENNEEVASAGAKQGEDLPGQVRINIKKDLPEDDKTKAEMVRRMGWQESQE